MEWSESQILFQLRHFVNAFFMNDVMIKGTFFFHYEGFLMRSPKEKLFLEDGALDLFIC